MNRREVGRIAIQLLLVVPMVLLFPFAVMLSFMSAVILVVPEPDKPGFLMTVAQLVAPVCLAFLFLSIFIGKARLRSPGWRRAITAGLVTGLVASVVWQVSVFSEPDGYPSWEHVLFNAVVFGGAVVVAGWNLWRAWRQEPVEAPAQNEAIPNSPNSSEDSAG
jgi:uncharacterized PurR-regulated membrane protein YhhQ (DUF165 family)